MRFRAPANVLLYRAQVILILAALVPTMLTTPVGVVLLASSGSTSVTLVGGILVLAFCASSIGGFILGSIFLRRGASLVRVQSDFLASVSHELRTPMTSMRMFVEALLDDRLTDPEERSNCLRVLSRELMRLDGLVERLLELSRLEAGQLVTKEHVLDPADVVRDSLAALDALQFPGADTGTKISPPDVTVESDLHIRGDSPSLVQALTNLLGNAWKYAPEGDHRISLAVQSLGTDEVEFQVCDNGPGVRADERARIFEKFHRGTAATSSGTVGSGLGLAIVQAVAEAHRGRVELSSPEAGGACFHLILPRAR